jgi:hypothetical protein
MRSAWAHFTSWWFYPVHAALTVPLIVLVALGIGGDAFLIAFRIMIVVAAVGYGYDHAIRRARKD